MNNRVTDPEVLARLAEEASFINSLMELDSNNYNTGTIPQHVENLVNEEIEEVVSENIELKENEDLVLNRNGEYVPYNSDMVFIEHRGYYVDEDEVIYLDFQGIDEDDHRTVEATDSNGDSIEVSEDYEELVFVNKGLDSERIFLSVNAANENGYKILPNGTWVFSKIIYENNVDKTKLTFYNDLEESLNQFYPNNWWFQSNNYTFDPNIETRRNTLSNLKNYPYILIIKFPYIKITNSENLSHEIEDLYVVIGFNDNGTSSPLMYGFRGKLNNVEYYNNYYHSHLPNGNTYDIGKFCLGSGDLVAILHKMSKEFDKNYFSYFLANLKVYVEWESIEGRPHRYMKDIVSKKLIIVDEKIINLDIIVILDGFINSNNINLLLEYNNETKLLDFNFKKLEESLSIYIINNYMDRFQLVFKDEEVNQYFLVNNINNNKVNNYKDPLCRLGEEDIFVEIKQVKTETTAHKKVLHPNITHYAKKYLVRRINEYYFQEN